MWSLSVTQSHDLTGTVFQRLIADRKFLATFYTRPEAATLLAHLAIPDDGRWHDPEQVKDFHVADYACGNRHANPRRLSPRQPVCIGWPAATRPRLHARDDGARLNRVRRAALGRPPDGFHALLIPSETRLQRLSHHRHGIRQDRAGRNTAGVSLGSLDLLGSNGEVRPLIPLHSATAVTGTGEVRAELGVDMPPCSQDLVIMNPPFTRSGSDWDGPGRTVVSSQAVSMDSVWTGKPRRRMSALAREYGKGTCAHGYAGIASWFVALADRMVRREGTIALVLPLTTLQGASWQKVRQLIARNYRDATILTIAAARPADQSFSADTGMAETMLVCRKSGRPRPAGPVRLPTTPAPQRDGKRVSWPKPSQNWPVIRRSKGWKTVPTAGCAWLSARSSWVKRLTRP